MSVKLSTRAISAAACVALLLPTAAACGGSSDDDKAAKAISSSLMKSSEMGLKKSQADCIGKAMVDKVGTADLKKYGLLTKDLKAKDNVNNVKMSKTDADGAATAVVDCVDPKALMTKSLDSSGQKMDAKTKKCLGDLFTKKVVHDALAASFSGDQAAAQKVKQKMMGPMMKCMSGALGGSSQQ